MVDCCGGKEDINHQISQWLDRVIKYTEEDLWSGRDKQKEHHRLLTQE